MILNSPAVLRNSFFISIVVAAAAGQVSCAIGAADHDDDGT